MWVCWEAWTDWGSEQTEHAPKADGCFEEAGKYDHCSILFLYNFSTNNLPSVDQSLDVPIIVVPILDQLVMLVCV
jgi:hypothetical protein